MLAWSPSPSLATTFKERTAGCFRSPFERTFPDAVAVVIGEVGFPLLHAEGDVDPNIIGRAVGVAEGNTDGEDVEFVLGKRLRIQGQRIAVEGGETRLDGDVHVLFNRIASGVFHVEREVVLTGQQARDFVFRACGQDFRLAEFSRIAPPFTHGQIVVSVVGGFLEHQGATGDDGIPVFRRNQHEHRRRFNDGEREALIPCCTVSSVSVTVIGVLLRST